MKIAIDIMGFENNISEALDACGLFLSEHNDLEIHIVGNEQEIRTNNFNQNIKIIHAPEFITQDDTILTARRKNNSSMKIATELLRDDVVDGILSAGNTGVFVYTAYSTIGLLDNINKIGFMPIVPNINNGLLHLVDVGATIDVNKYDLYNFAIMANIFAKQTIPNPRIGVLNIGKEKHKGTNLQHDVDELLSNNKKLNYIGFVESNQLLNNVADVVVTDGFTGNIALKACEGTVKTLAKLIKEEFKKPKNLFIGLLAKPIFKSIYKKFDYKNNAGALLLGLKKICVKTHGSADKKQFYSALKMLYSCIKNDIINKIKLEISNNNAQ